MHRKRVRKVLPSMLMVNGERTPPCVTRILCRVALERQYGCRVWATTGQLHRMLSKSECEKVFSGSADDVQHEAVTVKLQCRLNRATRAKFLIARRVLCDLEKENSTTKSEDLSTGGTTTTLLPLPNDAFDLDVPSFVEEGISEVPRRSATFKRRGNNNSSSSSNIEAEEAAHEKRRNHFQFVNLYSLQSRLDARTLAAMRLMAVFPPCLYGRMSADFGLLEAARLAVSIVVGDRPLPSSAQGDTLADTAAYSQLRSLLSTLRLSYRSHRSGPEEVEPETGIVAPTLFTGRAAVQHYLLALPIFNMCDYMKLQRGTPHYQRNWMTESTDSCEALCIFQKIPPRNAVSFAFDVHDSEDTSCTTTPPTESMRIGVMEKPIWFVSRRMIRYAEAQYTHSATVSSLDGNESTRTLLSDWRCLQLQQSLHMLGAEMQTRKHRNDRFSNKSDSSYASTNSSTSSYTGSTSFDDRIAVQHISEFPCDFAKVLVGVALQSLDVRYPWRTLQLYDDHIFDVLQKQILYKYPTAAWVDRSYSYALGSLPRVNASDPPPMARVSNLQSMHLKCNISELVAPVRMFVLTRRWLRPSYLRKLRSVLVDGYPAQEKYPYAIRDLLRHFLFDIQGHSERKNLFEKGSVKRIIAKEKRDLIGVPHYFTARQVLQQNLFFDFFLDPELERQLASIKYGKMARAKIIAKYGVNIRPTLLKLDGLPENLYEEFQWFHVRMSQVLYHATQIAFRGDQCVNGLETQGMMTAKDAPLSSKTMTIVYPVHRAMELHAFQRRHKLAHRVWINARFLARYQQRTPKRYGLGRYITSDGAEFVVAHDEFGAASRGYSYYNIRDSS